MKFYNRENEIRDLIKVEKSSTKSAKMTFIVGRRRIGKTTLIKESYKNTRFVYFFVARKSEKLLCDEFVSILSGYGIKTYGMFKGFAELFSFLMEYSKKEQLTLVIDEFQEFRKINSSIYSEMQNIWDQNKSECQMNLILSGSVYSLMKKIFENNKEPLFGRADKKMHLKPFKVNVLEEIYRDYSTTAKPLDYLAFYVLTGGIAKYVELFCDEQVFTFEKMLDFIFSPNSLLLEEGKNILIEEFGKEYSTYFSILSLIADSKTSRSEIESILEKDTGGFLEKLEAEYSIIKKVKPIFSKPNGRVQKYFIDDNFLNFWFRYVYKYKSIIELENFEVIKEFVKKDFRAYAGKFLEKYFKEKLALTHEYTAIGNYWERGNLNEIDIVAINSFEKKAIIAEVKLNSEKISLNKLSSVSEKLVGKMKNYQIEYRGYSLDDILF